MPPDSVCAISTSPAEDETSNLDGLFVDANERCKIAKLPIPGCSVPLYNLWMHVCKTSKCKLQNSCQGRLHQYTKYCSSAVPTHIHATIQLHYAYINRHTRIRTLTSNYIDHCTTIT